VCECVSHSPCLSFYASGCVCICVCVCVCVYLALRSVSLCPKDVDSLAFKKPHKTDNGCTLSYIFSSLTSVYSKSGILILQAVQR